MVILIVLFLTSLFLGPMLNNCCGKFGATMAALAHGLSVVGLVGFFELLWFLEVWQASHAVLGVVATCFIQRFFYKFFIAFFLSREFKHDEINRAWWTGVWYNRGLGSHVVSQPAREFVVKLVEVRPLSFKNLTGPTLTLPSPLPLPTDGSLCDRLHHLPPAAHHPLGPLLHPLVRRARPSAPARQAS